jgi:hypothetical protein
MRSVLGFFSLLAVSFLAAGVLAVIGSSSSPRVQFALPSAEGLGIDLRSLLIGLAAGLILSALARISWTELPRRTVAWLMANERNFVRIALAAIFIAVLCFY